MRLASRPQILVAATLWVVINPTAARAQEHKTHVVAPPDSATVAAGPRYETGFLGRLLLGNTYRALWTTPIRVPVFDLRTFEGGVKPTKLGGGLSTISLRLAASDGREFVFRLVDKSKVSTPPGFEGSIVDQVFRDQVSALHPAGAMISDPILDAGQTLHPKPSFAFMPDDPALGEFRELFANRLGMVEEFPNVPADGPAFGDAVEIIDSQELLKLLNADPMHRVDSRAMLQARLLDILLSDNDRHSGQWKWARMNDQKPTRWVPIPRDRDHAFIKFDGALIRLARFLAAPTLILFEGSDMNLEALTEHVGFDGRMLGDLGRAQWDSVASELTRQITDSVIDDAVASQPREYRFTSAELARLLRERRDRLHETAMRWYGGLAGAPDIHGTDADDRAIVVRDQSGFVDVRLENEQGVAYFSRRYDPRETGELRIFLHGGDDSAIVKGDVHRSIRVRIIGGAGENKLVDSSSVAADGRGTLLYDEGQHSALTYGPDTLFNRKPLVLRRGRLMPAGPDRGVRWVPRIGLRSSNTLGTVPKIAFRRIDYGFQYTPYYSSIDLSAEYATEYRGFRIALDVDQRVPRSRVHFLAMARMSDLDVVAFRGLGSSLTPGEAGSDYYNVRQRQWQLNPAVALAASEAVDISFGPAITYSITDSVPDRFISDTRPYGFGRFGEIGARLNVHLDLQAGNPPAVQAGLRMLYPKPLHRFILDFDATHYPAMWDVTSPFQTLAARVGMYSTLPFAAKTVLVARAGGKVLFGDFPFHESAFIGGGGGARSIGYQSFEGDAAIYGSAEMRIRAAKFTLMLPLDAGFVAMGDASRVFVDGGSNMSWNAASGGGLWLGLRDSPTLFTFSYMNENGSMRFRVRAGLSF